MNVGSWLLLATAVSLIVHGAFIAGLLVVARREDARTLTGFAPDRVVMFRRLVA
jgi:hypothetical protein